MMAVFVQAVPVLFIVAAVVLFNMPSNKDTPGRWWDA